MEKRKITYRISELTPYINWVYFYFAWQVRDAEGQARLRSEAERVLAELEGRYRVHAVVALADAVSDGDDLLVFHGGGPDDSIRIPMLRQQHPVGTAEPCLCLADFIRPVASGQPDRIGIFATTVDIGMETDFASDDYMKMMVQLLADRLAEAAAERTHELVRKEWWGYAPDERLTIGEMRLERFRGIRPAVGYPSLPDASVNFIIADILDASSIGIRLTESGAMKPHASVSGLMMAHPRARYFAVGQIGEDQLRDYSRRRGVPVEVMRRFLAANLR